MSRPVGQTDELARHVFFVGPRKSGTSAFYDVFLRHGIRLCRHTKESFFFEREEPDIAQYEAGFGLDPAEPFVEISPSYFTSRRAMDNLKAQFPLAAIVITLRHPVDRFISSINQVRAIGLEREFDRVGDADQFRNAKLASDYSDHIEAWKERFPSGVLVIKQVSDGQYSAEAYAALCKLLNCEISDQEFLSHRANPAVTSRSASLTKLLRRAIRTARRLGGAKIVRRFRFLKPLFFRTKQDKEDGIDRAEIEALLAREIDYFERLPDCQRF